MRRTFLTWLFLLIGAAFAVAGVLAFIQFQTQAQDKATQIMSTRLKDLLELVTFTQSSIRHFKEINDASTLEKARALAEIIRLNPAILQSQESLQGLCNDLGGSQIAVIDEKGIVTAGVPQSIIGYDIAAHEQSRPLLEGINTPGFELIQRPQNNGFSGQVIQYAAVHRLDQPGVIQFGIVGEHEQTVRSAASFAKLAKNFKLGNSGHVIAFREGALLNKEKLDFQVSDLFGIPNNQPYKITLQDEEHFAYAVSQDGFRLVGLVPCKEMREQSINNLWRLLQDNLYLFTVEFILVWVLLQKLVLNGISRIDESLRRITEGYKDERVDVTSCPEFRRLSTGINTMLDSLQTYEEQERQRMQRELKLARGIQTSLLPKNFPAFPDHPEFDLYATCVQSHLVGGDFYDFFMPDPQHVCFLVGYVSDQGIPAALFMMRAVSTIRSIDAQPGNLEELAHDVNTALYKGNTPGMRLSLFYGMLHIESGKLHFINAGKPQALLQHNKGEYEMMAMKSGPPMGYLPNVRYSAYESTLQPGDRIFLYTKGALDAANASNTTFGAMRLQEALRQSAPSITDVPRNVRTAIRSFIGDKAVHKDITLLALEYKGKRRNRASLRFTAGNPEGLQEMLDAQLESVFASPLAIQDIQQSISCIIRELPPDCQTSLNICCDEEEAKLEINYSLTRLNPLTKLPPLPLDHTEFSEQEEIGSTIKLWKKLA